MREIEPRDPILFADMFDTMLKYYNPNGDLPQYILGKADEDDYTGFPKIIMYFGGDEVFAGIAPDYEKSFVRCGVKDYQIKIKEGMPHGYTKMWIIPGTEDLQPYINAKDRIVKWISGTVGMAVFATVIAGVMTLIAR